MATKKRPPPSRKKAAPDVAPGDSWLLLVYRVPSEPSRSRVAVWRDLKRQGALFLQRCVCILPDMPACRKGIDGVVKKISAAGGTHFSFHVERPSAAQTRRLLSAFRQLSAKEYEEIIEECQTRFVKEIRFERSRENFTYEEAEEIREDFEKIRRWFERVVARDWFHAGQRERVAKELAHCEQLLEAFEEDVYRRAGADQAVHDRRPHND
ncbi:MAG: Chromate resistance protein ChrB [Acidiferrobacterales bacterium]